MSKTAICRDCKREFDPSLKHNKPGYINQCGRCAKDVPRYVGRNSGEAGKGISITIFRKNTQYWSRQISRENAVGFTANLPVGSPAALQKWEGRKEERERK